MNRQITEEHINKHKRYLASFLEDVNPMSEIQMIQRFYFSVKLAKSETQN